MGRQIESNSVCRSDCLEYKIGESFSIGDFSYTITGCTDGIYEAELSKCSNAKIEKAFLPEYVTSNCILTHVCSSAFRECPTLTCIFIPSTVISIDFTSFRGCEQLAFIYVHEKNIHYSSDADGILFNKDKTKLIRCPPNFNGDYEVPGSVIFIEDSAFSNCTYLKSVTIPRRVTSIGKWAFDECTFLRSVVILSNNISIGDHAFSECTSLTSVAIPNVSPIGENVFSKSASPELTNTSDISISIKRGAFFECTSLKSIIIPDGCKSIGDYAFQGCTSLISVTISQSVTSIGIFAFSDCESLKSLTLPNDIELIDIGLFSGCISLTSAVIPDGVVSICDEAFEDCTSLTSVNIPHGVTDIGEKAFYSCVSLKTLIVPDSVTSIGWETFGNCVSLTSVFLSDNITSIGRYAFINCTSLCRISVDSNNVCYSSESDVLFNKDKTELIFCSCCKKDTYLVPESVKVIKRYAFYNCSKLKAIVIPSNVCEIEQINNGSINRCFELAQVVVATNNSFYSSDDCGVLFNKEKTVVLYCPDGLSGDYTIPNTVKSVTGVSFVGCCRLKSITVPVSVSLTYCSRDIFFKEDGKTVVDPDNFGGFRYVFNGEKFIRDSAIVKYTVDGVEHTDYIKLKKE